MMNVEWDAFDLTKSAKQLNWCTYSSLGSVINHNTMESFKSFDKVSYYLCINAHYFYWLIKSKNFFVCRFIEVHIPILIRPQKFGAIFLLVLTFLSIDFFKSLKIGIPMTFYHNKAKE